MSDTLLVRFVDDQCAQVNWLLACEIDDASALAQRSILHAACALAELALIGYFAEQTQKRYNADAWQNFLAVGASFEALAIAAKQPSTVLAQWRQLERDNDSCFAHVLRAITQCKVPNPLSYKSSLLSTTSLSDVAIAAPALIASSNQSPKITLASLKAAWADVTAQIQHDRQIALEC